VELDGLTIELDKPWATPIIREGVYDGWYELPEREVLQQTLRIDDTYVELGGGLGVVATCACRIVGEAQVVVYEANPNLVEVIRRNARRNGFNPTVVNAVLGDHDGRTDFYVHEDFWISSLSPADGARRIDVPAKAFATEMAKLRPAYLMVDIEGAEIELLANDLPESLRAICVEVHPGLTGDAAVQRLIVSLIERGFSIDFEISHSSIVFLRR
jgi:FkbM family methyltransferase